MITAINVEVSCDITSMCDVFKEEEITERPENGIDGEVYDKFTECHEIKLITVVFILRIIGLADNIGGFFASVDALTDSSGEFCVCGFCGLFHVSE